MTPEQAAALRKPFPESAIGKLPRAGIQLDYIGHAAVTDRLLAVDPDWTWEPLAFAANGTPLWTVDAANAVMWIRLTVCGVTRLGVGICKDNAAELEKQLIGDALRNAAMRFGVALDLWSKESLEESSGSVEAPASSRSTSPGPKVELAEADDPSPNSAKRGGSAEQPPVPAEPPATPQIEYWTPGKNSLDKAKSRCVALSAIGVDIFDARSKAKLPPLDKLRDEADWAAWCLLIIDLETSADRDADEARAS